jgi:ribosome assembly protein YihI (activator of Der GTPase)
VPSYNTFGARMNHEQTQTHMTHHDPDLGEVTTFPLIVYSVLSHKANTQMSFCPEIPKFETLATLEAHTFVYRPPIEVKCELKL